MEEFRVQTKSLPAMPSCHSCISDHSGVCDSVVWNLASRLINQWFIPFLSVLFVGLSCLISYLLLPSTFFPSPLLSFLFTLLSSLFSSPFLPPPSLPDPVFSSLLFSSLLSVLSSPPLSSSLPLLTFLLYFAFALCHLHNFVSPVVLQ